jgi:hypothetical protein
VYRNVEQAEMTLQLATAFGAIVEYHTMPDIVLTFGTEVTDVKRIEITRLG